MPTDPVSQTFAWGAFLFLVAVVALVVLVAVALAVRRLIAMAARLQPVTATVRTEEGVLADVARRVGGSRYRVPYRYEYEVAGNRYSGSLPTLLIDRRSKAAALAALAAHQPGDAVTVYFDRDHPARSVFDNRSPVVPAWCRFGVWIAAAVALGGLVLMIAGS